MYKIAFRIMACPERKEYVDAEVEKLSGADVKVFYDDRPDEIRKGSSYTQLACINDALVGDYTHLCLLQDDLLLANQFADCIEKIVEARPLALWTLYCSRIKAEDLSFNSPYARIFPAETWGPGNVIPIPMLKKIMEFRQEKLPNYIYDDGLYQIYCIENGMPVYTTRVSLLQHLCPKDSILGYNDGRKVSKVWAGEDIFDRVNWGSREYKKYNFGSMSREKIQRHYDKYGKR